MQKSEKYMRLAIAAARRGLRSRSGGPFGACIVRRGKVVALGHNTVLRKRDATCHAEMNAIRGACRKLKRHDLSDCTLYTTAEPCPMCLGAMYWAGIRKVVAGVGRRVTAQFGFADKKFMRDIQRGRNRRKLTIKQGILQRECHQLFEEWQQSNGEIY